MKTLSAFTIPSKEQTRLELDGINYLVCAGSRSEACPATPSATAEWVPLPIEEAKNLVPAVRRCPRPLIEGLGPSEELSLAGYRKNHKEVDRMPVTRIQRSTESCPQAWNKAPPRTKGMSAPQ
jgi:hypothetical protein